MFLKPFEDSSYDKAIVADEGNEKMIYAYTEVL